MRIRAGDDINYCKAAIIKACLIRKHKELGSYKEELTLALNENSTNPAYLLGRLFAVLEKTQSDSNRPKFSSAAQDEGTTSKSINSPIRDNYFSSACATPATVFPVMLRLAQHHISKIRKLTGSTYNDHLIETIENQIKMDGKPYPAHLSLDEQGIFILGYYHQRNAFFVKKDKTNEEVQ